MIATSEEENPMSPNTAGMSAMKAISEKKAHDNPIATDQNMKLLNRLNSKILDEL